jgi:hypothetical protein
MLNIFRKIPVYVKVYHDKIEITNINTQQTISKTSNTKFSSNRLLVAEFNVAEMLIREILKELGLSSRTLKILIQQMKEFEDGLSEAEKRVLRDLAEQAGGAIVYIINRTKIMSTEEIQGFLNLKSSDFQVQDNKESVYPFISR